MEKWDFFFVIHSLNSKITLCRGNKELTNWPFSNKIWMHQLVSEHPGFIYEF